MEWYNTIQKTLEINKPFYAIVIDKAKDIRLFIGILLNNDLYALNTYLDADEIKQKWYKLNLNENDVLAWCPMDEEFYDTFY